MKINENQRESTKINENQRKSTKIDEHRRTSTKIYENRRKSTKIYENRRKSTKIYENLRKSTKIFKKYTVYFLNNMVPFFFSHARSYVVQMQRDMFWTIATQFIMTLFAICLPGTINSRKYRSDLSLMCYVNKCESNGNPIA